MRDAFPAWSNTVLWSLLALFVIGAIALPLSCIAAVRTPYFTGSEEPLEQPIAFDHRHHAGDDGIDCLYCHSGADRSAYAGVPSTSTCMGCHAQIWIDSPELEPVRRASLENRPVVWQRVNRVPDFVFFNHSIHVKRGVGCATCHGRVDLMARVYAAEPLTMRWCLDCHRDPDPHLRPLDRITDMSFEPTRAIGRNVREQFGIKPGTDCSSCHR